MDLAERSFKLFGVEAVIILTYQSLTNFQLADQASLYVVRYTIFVNAETKEKEAGGVIRSQKPMKKEI